MGKIITIHSDGGSRGNPGEAACGFTIEIDEKLVFSDGCYLGVRTNNEAEHMGIQLALKKVWEYVGDDSILCLLDSELVVRQLQGIYKIKNERLQIIASETFEIIKSLRLSGASISFRSIPRVENKQADRIVNQVLDKQAEVLRSSPFNQD